MRPQSLAGSPAADAVDAGRRRALQLGGLTIAFLWTGARGAARAAINARRQPGDAAAAAADGNPPFAPNAFIRIDADGLVRLVMPNVEMGQGIYTGACMMLAEELDVGMDQIRVEHAPPNEALYATPLLGEQATGGSTSTRSHWQVLREAGAVARAMLVAAAAARWHVDAASCSVARGIVTHEPSKRSASFGALAKAAAGMPEPAKVVLKSPTQFTLIGKPLRRVDSAEKVQGAARFGIDAQVPGMKIATVRACPTFGGKLVGINADRTRAIPGVVAVLQLDGAVAVVGDHFWAAKRGLDALDIAWDRGDNADLTTAQLRAALAERSRSGTPIVAREVGKKPAGKLVEAIYQLPMLAHAPMEPLNTTVWVTADKCEIWVGTQVPARCVSVAAKITGLPESSIVVHNHYLGGGFGRRLETDSVEQAVHLAKQVAYPLKVIWTREEDIRHDLVRPMYHDRISALLDAGGNPLWYGDRVTGGTVLGRWAPAAMGKNGLDDDTVECAAELPYDIPNLKVEWVRHDMPEGLSVGWWRGVGPTHNLFVVESFMDELAHAAGKDPVEFRRGLLRKNPRSLALLELAAQRIGWNATPLPPRVGRGVALGEPFGSRICAIVEAEVSQQGSVALRRVVVALDCGVAINPSSVEAQVQGGLLFGLSAALYSGITIRDGGIEQSNFHDYRNLRINETPVIELYRIESGDAPGGLGELCTAIAAPALGNAIFAATGVRLRSLPVDGDLLAQNAGAFKAVVGDNEAAGTNRGGTEA